MNKSEEFENENVHHFYSKKAAAFAGTRYKPWPFCIRFMDKYSTNSSLVLDCGCGNGRQFISANTVGLDYSLELLKIAQAKGPLDLVRGNIIALPFADGSFDVVLSIAAVHHLSTHQRRLQCLREMCRVMKDTGCGLIYAWGTHAASHKKFQHISESEYLVSWRGETDAMRYYYLFCEEELCELCKEAGLLVVESAIEQESVYAVVRKKRVEE